MSDAMDHGAYMPGKASGEVFASIQTHLSDLISMILLN